ncbi:type VI secretion system baseplate subunit TssF [Caballeronia sp. M1242]|uniref:type VI secretion system baseplate subunit TssF n=1 Tax=Caballeronia sp. M1242 TaxID=2814653 RepID=UPI0019D17082|nr:type VI secretion system baseplate subunit TssF [Caballeronia sp. M1242]QSN62829.1 type VI secretion system baseplate subunit TssF [Caballeronia sp. M1242]
MLSIGAAAIALAVSHSHEPALSRQYLEQLRYTEAGADEFAPRLLEIGRRLNIDRTDIAGSFIHRLLASFAIVMARRGSAFLPLFRRCRR